MQPTARRLLLIGLVLMLSAPALRAAPQRPNILLVVFEDMSARVGAYGDPIANTPHFDRLAAEGVRYTNVYTTAGVCAPARAALITGRYQQTMGGQHMRTHNSRPGFTGMGPAEYMAVPPPQVKAFPELLRAAGYYVINNGKTDYQFGEPFTVWDESSPEADWNNRPDGTPFFAMVNLLTTHEVFLFARDDNPTSKLEKQIQAYIDKGLAGREEITDPADVRVPAYLPDTPEIRRDIAHQYDNIHFTDAKLGALLDRLDDEGLLDDTIIIATTDHGDGLPRAKRSLYDSGLHVPLVIRYPDGRNAGTVRDDLVSFIDLGPTILAWAGVATPAWMHGRVFAGDQRDAPREVVFAARDRTDEFSSRRRAVRDARYKYIRSFDPPAPVLGPVGFRDHLAGMQRLRRDQAAVRLSGAPAALFEPAPVEQLFDTRRDPDEVNNLAADADHAARLREMRARLDSWLQRVGDLSAMPEAEMIEFMWPDGEQPVTRAPRIDRYTDGNGEAYWLAAPATDGASIGWRRPEDPEGHWHLYTGAVPVAGDAPVRFKAIRYGYRESDVVVARP